MGYSYPKIIALKNISKNKKGQNQSDLSLFSFYPLD